MMLEGTVRNGTLVADSGMRIPEGARLRFELIEDDDDELDRELDKLPIPDPSLPPDHPDAPYNREVELAILRESIAEMKAGGGRPFEKFMAELESELRSLPHGKE
jgi:hypothetical protein